MYVKIKDLQNLFDSDREILSSYQKSLWHKLCRNVHQNIYTSLFNVYLFLRDALEKIICMCICMYVYTHTYSALTEKHILYRNVYFFLKKKQKKLQDKQWKNVTLILMAINKYHG